MPGVRLCATSLVVVSALLLRQPEIQLHAETRVETLKSLGFRGDDITAIQRGEAVARVLDSDRREIAVIGAVRIKAPRERLAAKFRTIDYLKGNRMVLAAGSFSSPPRPEDLSTLSFELHDLDLRGCRPGDCRVRLSPEDISRFHREVDWRSAAWKAQSAAVWQQILTRYADEYFRQGQAGLPVFVNRKDPLSVRDESELLLGQSRFVARVAPGAIQRLRQPIAENGEIPDQLLFWSKEDFGIRPVMRVTHQSTHWTPESADGTRMLVIATNQIYASHYLDAAVGFIVALDAPGNAMEFDMIAINRARTRSLTGLLRGMIRSTVQGKCRDAMESVLRSTKAALE